MKDVFEKLIGNYEGTGAVGIYDKGYDEVTHIHAVPEEVSEDREVFLINTKEYPFIQEMLDEIDILDLREDGFRLVFNFGVGQNFDTISVNAEVGHQVAADLNPVFVFSSEALGKEKLAKENIAPYVLGIIWDYYNNPDNSDGDEFSLKFFFRCMYGEATEEDEARMKRNRQAWMKAMRSLKRQMSEM